MADKLVLIYSLQDQQYVNNVSKRLNAQNIDHALLMSESSEVIERKIEDCSVVLLVLTEKFRNDEKVKQIVKYIHDLNKSCVALSDQSEGFFNKSTWLKKEMDINNDIYSYQDEEQLGEVFAQLRSFLGMTVEPGERIGGVISVTVDIPCQINMGRRTLFNCANGGVYNYRIKAGQYTLSVVSKKLNAVIKDLTVDVTTNLTTSLTLDLKSLEYNYLKSAEENLNKEIFQIDARVATINQSIKVLQAEAQNAQVGLMERAPGRPNLQTSTGTMIGYAILFAFIGAFFFGFGAIIGLFVGPMIAQNETKKKEDKLYKDLIDDYQRRINRLNGEVNSCNSQIGGLRNELQALQVKKDNYQQQLVWATQYLLDC